MLTDFLSRRDGLFLVVLGLLPLTAMTASEPREFTFNASERQLQVATDPNHTYRISRSVESLSDWQEFFSMEGTGGMMPVTTHFGDILFDAVFYSMAKRNHFAKKGIGGLHPSLGVRADDLQPIIEKLQEMNITWFYNWGLRPDPRLVLPDDIEFVPMYWGARPEWPIPQEDLDWVRDNPKITHLLGFNEPQQPGQAEMTVEQALDAWPLLMATGKRLGAPAMANRGRAVPPNSWLGRFMQGIEDRGYRVDFIPIHIYQKSPNVGYVLSVCEDLYETYGLPVWITEWSLVDWNTWSAPSEAAQAAYLKQVVEAVESVPYIERHAWFALNDSDELSGGPWDMGLIEIEESYAGRDPETGRRLYAIDVELTPVGEAMRDADTSPGP